ncbi:hypothetical protein RCC89_18805 [Cytophagaceae bacterium ABcell3]|nr:hypothetical protein RCC89_18805 [Cytophagaceae bacterium ABcell3]
MEENKGKRREGKALKIISIVFLSLAFLVLGVLIVADAFLDDYIKDTITQEVREGTDGVYEVEIGELDLNVRTFRIEVNDIRFWTNEDEHAAQLDDPDPMPYIDLEADRLTISNINVWSFLLANRLQIGAVRLFNPVLNVRAYEQETEFHIEDIYRDLEEFADALIVNTIEIDSIFLTMAIQDGQAWNNVSLANGGLDVNNLRIDSASAYDKDKFLYTDRIQIAIQDTATFDLVGLYDGALKSFYWDSDDKLRAFGVNVRTDDSLYQHKVNMRVLEEPYISLALDSVELAFDEWGKLQQGGEELHVNHLVVNNPNIYMVAPPMTPGNGGKEVGYPDEQGFRMTFHEELNDLYPSITVGAVQMWNAHIHALLPEGADTMDVQVPDLNLNLAGIQLDSAGAVDTDRFMYASEVSVLTREGMVVRQGAEMAASTDMFLMASDSGVFVNNIQLSGAELPFSEASLASLNIHFTEWGALQQGDTTRVESIALHRPVFSGRMPMENGEASAPEQRGFQLDLHHDVNDIVPLLTIGSVAVSQANLSAVLENGEGEAPLQVEVPHIDILFSEFRIDGLGASDPSRFMYAQRGSVLARQGLNVQQGDEMAMRTGLFVASTDSGVFVRNIDFSGSASAQLDASLARMDLHFTQWGQLQQGQNTRIEAIALRSPVVRGDFELPDDEEAVNEEAGNDRGFKLDFHEGLDEFVALLTVGLIDISNADVQARLVNGEDVSELVVPDFNLLASELRLDAVGASDANRFVYAQEASLMMRQGMSFNQGGMLSMSTDQVVFATDSGFFVNNLQFEGTASPEVAASLEALNINFTQWGNLQQGKDTHVERIAILSPQITGFVPGTEEEEEVDDEQDDRPLDCEQEPDLYIIPEELSAFVSLLTVGDLQISNGFFDVKMETEDNEEPAHYVVEGLHLAMDNIRFDSAAVDADDRFLFAKNFDLNMDKVEALPDHLYTIKLEDFKANKEKRVLSMNNFELIPNYPKIEFAEILGEASLRMDIEVPFIEMTGIEYNRVLDLEFVADQINIRGAQAGMFLDRHLPPVEAEPPLYPHDQLTTLPIRLNIGEIVLEDGFLVYEELAEGGYESGEFTFEDFNATIRDVVNRPTEGYEETVAEVNFDLMGVGDFEGVLAFPVLDPDKSFTFSGELQPLNLEKLNPALEFIAFVRIEEGKMHSLRFEMEGNRSEANGDMYASYENLSIELLEEGPEEPGFPTTVISSIADRLLDTDNLEGTDDFTVGDMSAEREPEMEFTGLLVEALSRGMFDSFGVINLLDIVDEIQDRLPFIGGSGEEGEFYQKTKQDR